MHFQAASILALSSFGAATLHVPYSLTQGIWEFGNPSSPLSTRDIEANSTKSTCRPLPGDKAWPSVSDWNKLNATVGGRLIRGTPIAEVCYSNNEDGIVADSAACAVLQEQWPYVDP